MKRRLQKNTPHADSSRTMHLKWKQWQVGLAAWKDDALAQPSQSKLNIYERMACSPLLRIALPCQPMMWVREDPPRGTSKPRTVAGLRSSAISHGLAGSMHPAPLTPDCQGGCGAARVVQGECQAWGTRVAMEHGFCTSSALLHFSAVFLGLWILSQEFCDGAGRSCPRGFTGRKLLQLCRLSGIASDQLHSL